MWGGEVGERQNTIFLFMTNQRSFLMIIEDIYLFRIYSWVDVVYIFNIIIHFILDST